MSDERKLSKSLEALLGDVEKPDQNLVKQIKTDQIIDIIVKNKLL